MKKIHQMFTLQAKEKNLTFSLSVSKEINTKLIGDSFRLNQVLVNLIGNALKFTERGSIKILVKPLEVFNNKMMVQFQIQDTGIGIDNAKLEQIFERYKQVSAETAVHYGGTGLGLSISKQLIELQDGSMAVSSNPGGGSIFTFCIPYLIPISENQVEPINKVFNEQETFQESFRILIVDDSPLNQILLKEVISKFYFNAIAETVDNGIAAISMSNRFKYDVIILDMKMPDMDGTEVCKRIRQIDDHYAKLPIVGHTAGVTDEDRKRVKMAGMDYFLPKPFKREQLFQMFRDLGIVKS
jgi:CheY-like chemotaxis protein